MTEDKGTLQAFFYKHYIIAFLVLLGSGLFIGVSTLNLFQLVTAHWMFFSDNGWIFLQLGGFQQLIELVLTGISIIVCYLFFKLTEKTLSERLGNLRWPKRK